MKSLKPLVAVAALALAALVPFNPVAAYSPQAEKATKWWQSEKYQKQLVLTADQVRRIEEVFQKAMPKLKEKLTALAEAEAKFELLVDKGDDGAIMDQVAVMEARRAELNTSRTLMLLDMMKVLSKDQWAKFRAMHQQPPPAAATPPSPERK